MEPRHCTDLREHQHAESKQPTSFILRSRTTRLGQALSQFQRLRCHDLMREAQKMIEEHARRQLAFLPFFGGPEAVRVVKVLGPGVALPLFDGRVEPQTGPVIMFAEIEGIARMDSIGRPRSPNRGNREEMGGTKFEQHKST